MRINRSIELAYYDQDTIIDHAFTMLCCIACGKMHNHVLNLQHILF